MGRPRDKTIMTALEIAVATIWERLRTCPDCTYEMPPLARVSPDGTVTGYLRPCAAHQDDRALVADIEHEANWREMGVPPDAPLPELGAEMDRFLALTEPALDRSLLGRMRFLLDQVTGWLAERGVNV